MTRVATGIAGLRGWRRAMFTVVAGALSVLAFAPVHAWPILFLTFGALVFLLDGCHAHHASLAPRLKCAALIGFRFGFGFFFAGLYWIAEAFLVEPWRHAWLLPFVMTAMPGGMALFFAAACALAIAMWLPGVGRIFALAIAFGLAEFARGHVLTGLPWNLLGYALLGTLPFMQLAALLGVYALSLIAVLLFASPASFFAPAGSGLAGRWPSAALAALMLAALGLGYVWGEQRLASAEVADTGVRVRIVQANVDQADKWRPENSEEIFTSYLDLTRSGGLDAIDLVVWPETAVPFLLADARDALALIGDVLPQETSLLVGSARLVEEGDAQGGLAARRIYNSLLVVDDKGAVLDAYDKRHLVPFGEYLPFQDFLESLGFMQMTGVRGGFSEGAGSLLLNVPGAPQARPLICYEIIFPDEIASRTERPGWLLNLTNDAWFGSSAGPYQHFHQARVRAVEQGLPLVRGANTGISAEVDPYGRILAEIGLGESGVADANLPHAIAPTLFVQFGSILETSLLALAFACWLACRVRPLRLRRAT
ncbi:apolipoprotein N-acyltransferase [Methyloceanibacter sp.]|uniref:apolipoprotein N-acyltransferase n=1 Tax=Methyloceanibacter sp. TaxID=1965321 RepID=UPI002D0D9504|nr:apolipoprotein N-acyltransferase [Methyloceanibacter sp.]